MPPWLVSISPWTSAVAIGVAISLAVTSKIPEHANKVRIGAWIVGGAALGTAVAPGLGTVVGAGIGGLIAWLTN